MGRGSEPALRTDPPHRPGDPQRTERHPALTISSSGSYVLTSDLTGVPGLHGIVIEADDVTIDLNGFSLIGVPGSVNGIAAAAATADRVTIRNGTIRDWGGKGIEATGNFSEDWLVEDVKSIYNMGDGISLDHGAVVRNCTVSNNGGDGISVSGANGAIVENCTANNNNNNNGGDGISARGVVRGCTTFANGFHGISVNRGVVEACASSGNTRSAVVMTSGLIINCSTSENDDSGRSGSAFTLKNSSSSYDDVGIRAGNNSRIEGNHVSNATFSSISAGAPSNNVIMLNNTVTASGGPAYQLFTGNPAGPIVNVVGVMDITTIPNHDHPWANFIH